MGREVKRIHLDWDFFEREEQGTWKGYIMDPIKCLLCGGSGKNLKGKTCPQCDGEEKVYPQVEPPKYYEWNKKDFGYQIWQDVSEGGPVSPVFKKPEDLAKWMVENDTSITRGTTYEAWLKMIKEMGGCPSMIGMLGKGIKSGMVMYEDTNKKA